MTIQFRPIDSFIGSIDDVSLVECPPWVTRTSSLDAVALAVDITGYLFYAGTKGLSQHSVTLQIQYRPVAGSWLPFNDSGDFVVISNSDRTPVRVTYRRTVAKGQYEVRLRRVSAVDSDVNKYTSDLSWSVLRSYQRDEGDYSGQHRLAMQIRATGQLQGRIDALSSLASANCEAWTGSAWGAQINSNPAWWFRWFAKGKTATDGRRMFGAGMDDVELDIEALKDWGAWCDSKSLQVNLVIDRKMSVYEVLSVIARCGRASVTWSSGKLGVIWDADNLPVVQRFGMGNIIRDSFRIDYVTGSLVDAVEIEFINPALNWQPDTVRANVPGVVSPVNIATIKLFGCTSKIQAEKEALLQAAQQYYRRRRVSWDSDFEGMAVQRGDVVTVSHDLTSWGYSGRLQAGTTTVLELDKAVPFMPATTHYVGVRFPDGSYEINEVVYQVGESASITLSAPLSAAPDSDPDGLPVCDYLWFFEPEATPGKKLKVLDVQPVSDSRVRITATDEDPAYYAEESGSGIYVDPSLYGSYYPTLSNLEVSDTLVLVGNTFAVTIGLAWDVEGDYAGAWVRWRMQGEQWKPMIGTMGALRSFEFQGPPDGTIEIEVTGFNHRGSSGENSTIILAYVIVGDDDPIDDVPWLVAAQNDNVAAFRWGEVPNIDTAYYRFVIRPAGDTNYEKGAEVAVVARGSVFTSADLPPGTWNVGVKAYDHNNPPVESVNATWDEIDFQSSYDVIDTQNWAGLGWPGILTGFVKHWTGVLVPSSQTTPIDAGWDLFENSTVISPVEICIYQPPEQDVNKDNSPRCWGVIQAVKAAGETQLNEPMVMLDYHVDGGSYDGFDDWPTPKTATGRNFQFKFELNTQLGVAFVSGFETTLDIAERVEKFYNVAIDAAGTVVLFNQSFHSLPYCVGEVYGVDLTVDIDDVHQDVSGVYDWMVVRIYDKSTQTYVSGTASILTVTGA